MDRAIQGNMGQLRAKRAEEGRRGRQGIWACPFEGVEWR